MHPVASKVGVEDHSGACEIYDVWHHGAVMYSAVRSAVHMTVARDEVRRPRLDQSVVL